MGIDDSDDKKNIDIKLEPCCDVCTNLKVPIKPETSCSTDNITDYLRHQYGSDDKKVINIKQEPCCEICNNPNVSMKLETSCSTSSKTDNEIVDYDNLNLEDSVNKQHVNQLLSKGMW